MWTPTVIIAERDIVAILLEVHNLTAIIVSVYSPPKADIENSILQMQQLMREQKIDNVLIAGDFNCHSTTWGYATTEPKGRTLEDFISSNNLILHNQQDAPPTFDRVHSRGWPDLTVSTLQMAQLVQDWMVVEGVSLSDHNYIRFTIARATETTIIRRYNLPGRKVRSFVTAIKSRLAPFSNRIEQATTREELHVLTSELMSTIRTTCDDILPVRTIRRVTTLNWWNSQLRAQQQMCRALRRRLKSERRLSITSNTLTIYQKERAQYKKK
ncbi:uncharacterized protein LOC118189831 [Stegodyphus dumicola]|uniref:uncharacterized protein LOC118189831 n=1 Tax=Stegodyphus dumicola TaxID=202533 RepID=UPI0015A8875F|nr:uncharacterized protein LOC118189831 [Stegodyphus dumicola]